MKKYLVYLYLFFIVCNVYSQTKLLTDTVKSKPFQNGKMWTFDNPPIEYFEKTYGFKPSKEWLLEVQMSALRFAEYCSASFVSEDGLVMTNHHCARESGESVSKPEENLMKNGFYAKTLKEERKVEGLFVDQLILLKDVSEVVLNAMKSGVSDEQKIKIRDSIMVLVKKQHQDSIRWKGLELQVISFYKGGQFSLYGFKRHHDVRLVFMPELDLGYYGGDFDNFTYPRYAFDCSFFRVYENDKPLKTKYFFKFNPEGAKENEPVFVIGNPGRTERLSTKAQLDFFRDISYPSNLTFLRKRADALTDYNKILKNDSVMNEIFRLENSFKATTGMLEGLNDSYIYAQKIAFENEFKEKVSKLADSENSLKIWDEITQCRNDLKNVYYDYFVFNTRAVMPKSVVLGQIISDLILSQLDTASNNKLRKKLQNFQKYDINLEKSLLKNMIEELYLIKGINEEIFKLLEVKSKDEALDKLFNSLYFVDKQFLENVSKMSNDELKSLKDPLILVGDHLNNRFKVAKKNYDILTKREAILNAKLAQLFFKVYGKAIPPDATFSLRIADGVVKGYEYNGTKAPYKTTFFGLYDRYYSFNKTYPFGLPEKWQNPDMKLLQAPYNFVSTNDIIGGNSGSAIINKNKEAVGLIFDGNMESLPGRFIFTDEANRTVSVHAGGMIAAMKYVYKANRLVEELLK